MPDSGGPLGDFPGGPFPPKGEIRRFSLLCFPALRLIMDKYYVNLPKKPPRLSRRGCKERFFIWHREPAGVGAAGAGSASGRLCGRRPVRRLLLPLPSAGGPGGGDRPRRRCGRARRGGDRQEDPEALARAAHLERKDYFYTILLSGSDDGNGNSDTNILLGVDAENGRIHGVSIPRDTKAVWDGKNHKINAAFGSGGVEKLADVVGEQLGIPVDFTVAVDLTGFEALVDAIGGVDFEVPINMNYDDPYQDLHIHFSAGMQHLTGEEAMKVVRFRHNNDGSGYGSEDIGRMETQQKFLKAVARQTLTLSNLDKIDDFVKIFQEYVETDLTLGNLAWLGKEAISMGAENITFSTLPNEWRSPYIYLDPAATLEVVNQIPESLCGGPDHGGSEHPRLTASLPSAFIRPTRRCRHEKTHSGSGSGPGAAADRPRPGRPGLHGQLRPLQDLYRPVPGPDRRLGVLRQRGRPV